MYIVRSEYITYREIVYTWNKTADMIFIIVRSNHIVNVFHILFL